MPLYDTFKQYPQLRHILVRHEQGASFAADGFARASEKVGVCIATSGPGATNLVTGIANAYMDSIPVVAITGQVVSSLIGSDAFQESDMTGITLPITKHNYLVTDVKDLAQVVKEAFYIARTGRPGPVHIDITKSAQSESANFNYQKIKIDLPGYRILKSINSQQIQTANKLIAQAKMPVIIIGHGALIAKARKEVLQFAERIDAAITTTLLGITTVPFNTKNYLGMLGMHGQVAANYAIAHSDLIISLGSRFDDRITGKLGDFESQAKIIR